MVKRHSRRSHRKLPRKVSALISRRTKLEYERGRPLKQSVAIGYSKARKKFPKYAKELEKK